jgi:hypothetical protein
LINELLSYRYKKNADGQYADTPEKKDDHGPDALGYGLLILFDVQATEAIGKQDTPKDHRPITAGILNKRY